MANSNQPIINITDIEQLGFVVYDVHKSVESMWNTFGLGPWFLYIFDADDMGDMAYYGKSARFSFRMACTQNKVGGVEIELIEPIGGDNIYRDFLREHGAGFHHVGWYNVSSPESFIETVQKLEEAGFPCMMSAQMSEAAFAYFDTTGVLGTILEVSWRSPSIKQPPHPDYVFP